jgi:hypothetical protein
MPIKNFDKVELLLPMTGANNGTVFTDYSLRQRAVTRTGAVTSTAQSKFSAYGSSGYFNGSSYLSINDELSFPGDFFVRGWVYAGSLPANACFFGRQVQNPPGLALQFRVTSSRYLQAVLRETSTAVTVTGTTVLPTNEWAFLELARVSGTIKIFLNGTEDASASNSFDLSETNRKFVFGGNIADLSGSDVFQQPYTGHMQDWIIGKNGGGNTANYTPPARMTQRTLTRVNTGTDSHEFDRAVLFDFNGGDHTGRHRTVLPDSSGDFVADDLIDLEYGVAFVKGGCGPECRGPVLVDPDT